LYRNRQADGTRYGHLGQRFSGSFFPCPGMAGAAAPLSVPNAVRRPGNPDPELISTSYVERQNLTMRMGMRRFTRLTNAFSKKVENLAYAVALHFMHYNFCRPHQSLGSKTTPAMASGIADHVWTVKEIAELFD
jgi:hypothetical protein